MVRNIKYRNIEMRLWTIRKRYACASWQSEEPILNDSVKRQHEKANYVVNSQEFWEEDREIDWKLSSAKVWQDESELCCALCKSMLGWIWIVLYMYNMNHYCKPYATSLNLLPSLVNQAESIYQQYHMLKRLLQERFGTFKILEGWWRQREDTSPY